MTEEPLFRRSPFSDPTNDVWRFFDLKRKSKTLDASTDLLFSAQTHLSLRVTKTGLMSEELLAGVVLSEVVSDGWVSPLPQTDSAQSHPHRYQIDLSACDVPHISVALFFEEEQSLVELVWKDAAPSRAMELAIGGRTPLCVVRNVFHLPTQSKRSFVLTPHVSSEGVCTIHEHLHLGERALFQSIYHTNATHGITRCIRLAELKEGATVRFETRGEIGTGASWQEVSDLSHIGPCSHSVVRVRTVCHDQGQLICQSLARLGRGVVNAKTDEQIAVLLLNGKPDVRLRPFLSIEHDVVEGAHGASIGGVSEASLLYLFSRGISREIAVNLLKQAFLES